MNTVSFSPAVPMDPLSWTMNQVKALFTSLWIVLMSCCANLEEIQKACAADRKTARGLKGHFWIACTDDVQSIPAKDDYPTTGSPHTVSTDIVMEATKVFVKIAFDNTPGTNAWNVTEAGEGQAKYYVTESTGFIPGIAPLPAHVVDGLLGGEYVIIMPDKNGFNRLVGAADDGASIFVAEQNTEKNGFPFTIRWESSSRPLFYTGAIPE